MKNKNDKIKYKYEYKFLFILIIILFTQCVFESKNIVYAISIENNNKENFENEEINSSVIKNINSDVDINKFIEEADRYSKDSLNLDISNLLNEAIKGKIKNRDILDSIMEVLFKEFSITIKDFCIILIIIILNAIFKSISDNLENTAASEIIYIVQYALIVTIILKDFSNILNITNNTIYNLIGFCNSLFPILTTLIIMSGKIIAINTLEPILLIMISFIANIIGNFILPLIMIATVFSIASNLSDMIQFGKISKFIKSAIIWFLGIMLTLFIAVISLEGTLSTSVDVVATKTTKAAVSGLIPVVGKILGDAADTVLGSTCILKNAVGIVGVIVIISICIIPIIKLSILSITYTLLANICSVIADRKIVQVLSEISSSFKMLLAIICTLSTLLIIGLTLVIRMTNVGIIS